VSLGDVGLEEAACVRMREACFLVGAGEVCGSSRGGESVATDAKSEGQKKRATWLNVGRINGVDKKG
jgi:hypothetical protein